MTVQVEYDVEADAMYVRLAEGQTASTDELDHSVAVDRDADGGLLGLEMLAPHRHVAKLPVLAERLGFLDRLGEVSARARAVLHRATSTSSTQWVEVAVAEGAAFGATVGSGSVSVATGVRHRDEERV